MIEKYPAIPEIAKAVPNNIAAKIIGPLTYLQILIVKHGGEVAEAAAGGQGAALVLTAGGTA
jgi:hypothetical protein